MLSRLGLQLGAIAALALLPLFALLTDRLADERRAAVDAEIESARRAASVISDQNRHFFDASRSLLRALAAMPAMQSMDWQGCEPLVQSVQSHFDGYAFVGVVDSSGTVVCSSISVAPGTHVRDRLWFGRVLSYRDFVTGEYVVGRGSARPSIHLAYPLRRDGDFFGAVNVGVDVAWLAAQLAALPLHPDRAYWIIDSEGMVLARTPEAESYSGKPFGDVSLLTRMLAQKSGVIDAAVGPNGENRTVVFESLVKTLGGGGIMGVVTLDNGALLADIERDYRGRFLVTFGIMLLILALLWVATGLLVGSPLHRIAAAARRIENGELAARVGPVSVPNEMGVVAAAFDRMAGALEAREMDRKELERKDLLLAEVVHRIKNHLSSLAAMAYMKAQSYDAQDARSAVMDMHHRVVALGRLYDMLLESAVSDDVRLADYVSRVCDHLAEFVAGTHRGIRFRCRASGSVEIGMDKAVAVGMLLNELVTNSLKHAFPDGEGQIDVHLNAEDPATVLLSVSDSGQGMPKAEIESDRRAGRRSLGLLLIDAMVQQLGAELRVYRDGGTRYHISFSTLSATVSVTRKAALTS